MKNFQKHLAGRGLLLVTFAVFAGTGLAAFSGCAGGGDEHHPIVLYSSDGSSQSSTQAQGIQWNVLSKGLEYADSLATLDDGTTRELFLVRVNPRLFEFKIYQNKDQVSAKSLQDIHTKTGSVLTFNGAFFDKSFNAMGMLQDSSSTSHPKASSDLMNGIFYVANEGVSPMAALIPAQDDFKNVPDAKHAFMLQNGPALLDNQGGILPTSDTGKQAGRTALGVDKDGNVVLIVLHQDIMNTDNALSLYQFAHLLKENSLLAPLGLHGVLNLDGGPSTGVAVGGEYLPESNLVENAVVTLPRVKAL